MRGLNNSEVAVETGLGPGAVRVHYSRGIAKLRAVREREESEGSDAAGGGA